jgi:uncharacterized membrane protein
MGDDKHTRLVFLGFTDEMLAKTVLEVIKEGRRKKAITVEDWVMVQKTADGELKVTNDKGADPGGARGAMVGGVAGWALATLAGPIGLGAMIGGAAIGAITAKVKDSGIKNDDVDTVTGFMVPGRTGLMLAIPLEEAGGWDAFVAENAEFHSAIRRHQMDITPDHSFEQGIEDYRRQQEAKQGG